MVITADTLFADLMEEIFHDSEKDFANFAEFNFAVEAFSKVSRNLISWLSNILQGFLVQKKVTFQ